LEIAKDGKKVIFTVPGQKYAIYKIL
jgi:hypothetical protein